MRSQRAPVVLLLTVAAACGGGDGGTNPPENQVPVAAFATPTCSGLDCTFTDGSSDPDGASDLASWSWNFGDDATATDQNPAHTYAAAGDYGVTLVVADKAGAKDTVTHTVTVSAPGTGPTANFDVTCNGLACTFTDTSTPSTGLTWAWDFGEPTSGANNTSSEQNPTHTYTATAVTDFTVTLTVTDAQAAQNTKTRTITVTPAATCTNASDQTIGCTLDISERSTLVITLTSRDCAFTGNEFDITDPIVQKVFTNGCSEPVGTQYTINGPDNGAFGAGPVTFQFTQGVGAPDDPPRVPPQIKLVEDSPGHWTISIDDGGNSGMPGEPDFNDIVLTAVATAAP